MLPLDRRTAFARHTQWLALALEALVLVSLFASAVPLAPSQPVWWLRLSDAAVNFAPVLLLAVILLRLGSALLDNDSEDTKLNGRRSVQLASRWAFLFALLVPLQLIGYAWLWADSDSQLNRQINQGERGVAALRSRIQASSSEAELSSLLAAANPRPLPPLQGGSLAERKQQLSEAIAINTSRISSSLRDQRAERLRTSLPGTLRVLFGAAIVSAFLFLLRRQIRTGLQVAAHHGEAMLQGGGGDEPIGAVVSEGGRELAPAASTPDAPLPLYGRRQDLPDSS